MYSIPEVEKPRIPNNLGFINSYFIIMTLSMIMHVNTDVVTIGLVISSGDKNSNNMGIDQWLNINSSQKPGLHFCICARRAIVFDGLYSKLNFHANRWQALTLSLNNGNTYFSFCKITSTHPLIIFIFTEKRTLIVVIISKRKMEHAKVSLC